MAVESAADRSAFFRATGFGTTVTWTPQGGSAATLEAIFDDHTVIDEGFGRGAVPVQARSAQLLLSEADLPDGASRGDAVSVDGGSYDVKSIRPDGTGLAVVTLESVRFRLISTIMGSEGDSRISQGIVSSSFDMRAAWPMVRDLSLGRVDHPLALAKGVGSETIAQVRARWASEVDAAKAAGAGMIHMLAGTNTATDPSAVLADVYADIDWMQDYATGKGLVVVGSNELPRYDYAAGSAQILKLEAIRDYLASRHNPARGRVIFDGYSAFADAYANKATTGMNPLRDADMPHLSHFGGYLYCKLMLAALDAAYPGKLPSVDLYARSGVVNGPAFDGVSPTGYVLSGQTATAPDTITISFSGGWLEFVVNLAASASSRVINIARTWSWPIAGATPGTSLIEMFCEMEMDAGSTGLRHVAIDSTAYKSGYSPLTGFSDGRVNEIIADKGAIFPNEAYAATLRTNAVLLPADAARLVTNQYFETLANVPVSFTGRFKAPSLRIN